MTGKSNVYSPAAAIRAGGGARATTVHVDTDHGWSDRRLRLQSVVIDWRAPLAQAR